VLVPTDPYWKYQVNMAIQIVSIVLYSILLAYVLHNTYVYLWLKQRYKVMTHSVFYTFAICLAVGRIYQHACTFKYLTNYKLRLLNNLNDGFSVCIGIS
jgi:hypothetical protein